MARFHQGEYEVQNKSKYVGTKNPTFRSSWELRVFTVLDKSPLIIRWGAETVVIPYYSPIDARSRRYMIDLFIEYHDKNGKLIRELVEIKPLKETRQPKASKNKSKRTLLKEIYTYEVNKAKWIAASLFANKRNMRFRVLTEKDIFPE